MGAAENILAELESIGVLGGKPVASVRAVKAEAPSSVSQSVQAPQESQLRFQVMEHCERAVDLLERSIEAQMELREVFVSLHSFCRDDPREGPGDEDEQEGDDPEQEAEESQDPTEPVVEASPEDNEEQLPQTDVLAVPPAVPLISEEQAEEPPLLQETQVSAVDTGSAIQDLIAQTDMAYRKSQGLMESAGPEAPIPPPRSLEAALNTVQMPPARRAFFEEMKEAAEGKPKKRRTQ